MQIRAGSYNIKANINGGCAILKHLIRRCNGDVRKALTAYHRGYAGMKRYYARHNKPDKYANYIWSKYAKF
jgi:soluble lytic murein transglycosylase-like protein